MKAISIRLDDNLGARFDEICHKTGYKKNTLLTRLIEAFVQSQSGRSARKTGKQTDPFSKVIGIAKVEPLLGTRDIIDKVVYNL